MRHRVSPTWLSGFQSAVWASHAPGRPGLPKLGEAMELTGETINDLFSCLVMNLQTYLFEHINVSVFEHIMYLFEHINVSM